MGSTRVGKSLAFTLYGHYESGNVYKVALMLALSGQSFAYRHVDIFSGEQREAGFENLSRFREVPALLHGDHRLVQSGAILLYLAQTLEKFAGEDEESRWRIQEWLFWENHRLLPSLALLRYQLRWVPDCDSAVIDFCKNRTLIVLDRLDRTLQDRTYLVGKGPSIADIACSGYVWFLEQADLDIGSWPALGAWRERLSRLPGWKPAYDLLPRHDTIVDCG